MRRDRDRDRRAWRRREVAGDAYRNRRPRGVAPRRSKPATRARGRGRRARRGPGRGDRARGRPGLQRRPRRGAGRARRDPPRRRASCAGADRAAGAVAALAGIRNPVTAARAVLDEGRHVHARRRVRGALRPRDRASRPPPRTGSAPTTAARVRAGDSAAARSAPWRGTRAGGSPRRPRPAARNGKHPGRVGDSPLIAAGTWADDSTAAISCTGDGEAIMRIALAHEIDALMRHAGLAAGRSVRAGARGLATSAPAGLIAVGRAAASPRRSRPPRCRAPGGSETARQRRRRARWLTSSPVRAPAGGVHRRRATAAAKEIRKAGDRETAAVRRQAAEADARRLDREPGRARASPTDRDDARRGRGAARGAGRGGRPAAADEACATRRWPSAAPSTPS